MMLRLLILVAWFFCTTAVLCSALFIHFYIDGFSDWESATYAMSGIARGLNLELILLVLLPYVIYQFVLLLVRLFSTSKITNRRQRVGMFTFIPIVALGLLYSIQPRDLVEIFGNTWDKLIDYSSSQPILKTNQEKIRGVHFFNRSRNGHIDLEPLVLNHVDHLVLVPYAYQETYDDPNLRFGGRRRSGISRDSLYHLMAVQAREAGMKMIIKPHIWMRTEQGKWRSDIEFKSESDWANWFDKYSQFILHYAKLSEKIGAPYYCVGTELSTVTKKYPAFWKTLIERVRNVYSGELFYAANWYQEYQHIEFWDALDLIGVQAYFPISKEHSPSVTSLCKSWDPHRKRLQRLSVQLGKPILFSELGYKSTSDAAIKPWEWVSHRDQDHSKKLSTDTQANCYEAFFRTFWNESWFAGTLVWQWRGNHSEAGGMLNIDFTPQNKPAESIIAKWFGK